jgi:chaperonin GroEL
MKQYKTGNDLLLALLEGSRKLEENVAGTLGPRGKNVILRPLGCPPIITKDGVTVAKFVDLEDPAEDLACQILKQASIETVKEAGDGTTTSTVLAHAVFEESSKYVLSGIPPIELKRGMDKAAQRVYGEIAKRSSPISTKEDIKNIATISSNNDVSIGDLIAEAVDGIGRDGSIVVEDGKSTQSVLEFVEGIRLQGGFVSHHFANDSVRNVLSYKKPYFLITDHVIDDLENALLPVLNLCLRDKKPLIIIADGYGEEVSAACIYNALQSRKNLNSAVKVACLKAPSYGENRSRILEDVAISVGAKFFSMFAGDDIATAKLVDLGGADKIEANGYHSTIIGGQGYPVVVEERIDALKTEIESAPISDGVRLQERITRLGSTIALIKVGGHTDVEVREVKDRIDDALEAVNSARVEGIIAGGGSTLLNIALMLEREAFEENDSFDTQEKFGVRILLEALKAPFKRIATNSGYSWEVLINLIKSSEIEEMGIDFLTGELKDLKECGIIDPAKVARVALQNALSAASTLITTNNAIMEISH